MLGLRDHKVLAIRGQHCMITFGWSLIPSCPGYLLDSDPQLITHLTGEF